MGRNFATRRGTPPRERHPVQWFWLRPLVLNLRKSLPVQQRPAAANVTESAAFRSARKCWQLFLEPNGDGGAQLLSLLSLKFPGWKPSPGSPKTPVQNATRS